MKNLNIACGSRYHKDWINIDFYSDSKNVRGLNILDGLPFEDQSIDAIYSSHFLEHLKVEEAKFVLKESHRILKPLGVIRIVVPDLENVCREYLKNLEKVGQDEESKKKYDWIVVELLDQMTRDVSRGKMGKMFDDTITRNDTFLSEYILHRTGDDLLSDSKKNQKKKITIGKIKNKLLYTYIDLIKMLVPQNIRKLIFVNTPVGEKHKWMYDKYSLSAMLKEENFKDITIESFNTSRIKNFESYYLDNNLDGSSYKGIHSLYIEAIR